MEQQTELHRVENKVFTQKDKHEYDVHTCIPTTGLRQRVRMNQVPVRRLNSELIPALSVPTSLGTGRHTDKSHRLAYRKHADPRIEICKDFATFAEYARSQPPHICNSLVNCNLSDEVAAAIIAALISPETLSLGTDGGLAAGIGMFGFAWGDSKLGEVIGRGKGYVAGSAVAMSSTRTKLWAILESVTYLRLVVEFFRVTLPANASCICCCDSKAELSRLEVLSYEGFGTTWRCRAHYDLEAAIGQCLCQLPEIQFTWQWVRGHASKRKPAYKFTWDKVLNKEADELATSA